VDEGRSSKEEEREKDNEARQYALQLRGKGSVRYGNSQP
jgi:hypothetical protein